MDTKRSADPIDKYVGSRVRSRRKSLKISRVKLAGEIGITHQQIQKYETGANRIGASRLQQIASVLAVPMSYFFEQDRTEMLTTQGIGIFDGNNAISAFVASHEGMALNVAFSKIKDASVRNTFVTLVKAIASGASPLENAVADIAEQTTIN